MPIHGHAPFLAADPPTIRLFATLENPHPSFGVSKRPLMSKTAELFEMKIPISIMIDWREKNILTSICQGLTSKETKANSQEELVHFFKLQIILNRKKNYCYSSVR